MPSVINHDRQPHYSADFNEMYALREDVLGIGQDEHDENSIHHVAFSQGMVIAAGRGRADLLEQGAWHAEHLVVSNSFKDPDQAKLTILSGLEKSIANNGGQTLELQADINSLDLLRSIGFVAVTSRGLRNTIDMHKIISGGR